MIPNGKNESAVTIYNARKYGNQLTLLVIRSAYTNNNKLSDVSDTNTVDSVRFNFTLQARYLAGHDMLCWHSTYDG